MADSRRLYLHVGLPKSGTTYLQEKLWHNRKVLRDNGLLYPGEHRKAHLDGAMDLRAASKRSSSQVGGWGRLVDQARAGSGDVLISKEHLTFAEEDAIAKAMADLSWAEVHVVLTVRDLARTILGMWQEKVKNRQRWTYTDWINMIRNVEPNHPERWYRDGPAAVLRPWVATLPPERVHVVTVPQPGSQPNLLWDRFADLVGVDSAVPLEEPRINNASMGVVETNLLRRLNDKVPHLSRPTHARMIKNRLAMDVLATRPGATKLAMPAEDQSWTLARSKEFVRELRDSGFHIVGDLDELIPRFDKQSPAAPHPDQASDAELLDAALDALIVLMHEIDGRADPGAALARTPTVERPARSCSPSAVRGLRRTVRYLADHNHPQAMWLRDRYRSARSRLNSMLGRSDS